MNKMWQDVPHRKVFALIVFASVCALYMSVAKFGFELANHGHLRFTNETSAVYNGTIHTNRIDKISVTTPQDIQVKTIAVHVAPDISKSERQKESINQTAVIMDILRDKRIKPRTEGNAVLAKNYSVCGKMKFLVFLCTKDQTCGGLGDRQKEIISTYLLAMLLNRTFVIIHDKPCDISQFLVPNEYDWQNCRGYIQTEDKSKKKMTSIKNLLNCTYPEDCVTKPIVSINTNQIWIHKLAAHPLATRTIPWTVNKTIPEVSKLVLSKLFRPSDLLQTAGREFITGINERQRLVCSHIRIGKNPTLPNDKMRPLSVPNVNAIFSFLKKFDTSKHFIYIATDSDTIRKQAKGTFTRLLTTNLPIVHVDRVRKDQTKVACRGLYGALFEQYILSNCDVLLLTRSNMGAMAAYMSRKQQKIFIFYHKNHTIFNVTMNGIQHYFNFI